MSRYLLRKGQVIAMDRKPSTWSGTWIGNWEGGSGIQIIFSGDELIGVYWNDDYLHRCNPARPPTVRPSPLPGRRAGSSHPRWGDHRPHRDSRGGTARLLL